LNFESLISVIEQTHLHFQQQAVKAVNVSLTVRNWLIGFYIVEFELRGEDRAQYGDKLFTELAKKSTILKELTDALCIVLKIFTNISPFANGNCTLCSIFIQH
jgi:hypothetical protein